MYQLQLQAYFMAPRSKSLLIAVRVHRPGVQQKYSRSSFEDTLYTTHTCFKNITISVSSMKAENTTQQLPCQRSLPVGGGGGLRSFRRVVVVVVVVAAGLGVTGVDEGLACEVLVLQGLLRLSVVTTTKQQRQSYTRAENKQLMLSTLSVCVRASSAGTKTKYLYQAVKLLVMTFMRMLWLKFPPCYIHDRDVNIFQSSAGN